MIVVRKWFKDRQCSLVEITVAVPARCDLHLGKRRGLGRSMTELYTFYRDAMTKFTIKINVNFITEIQEQTVLGAVVMILPLPLTTTAVVCTVYRRALKTAYTRHTTISV